MHKSVSYYCRKQRYSHKRCTDKVFKGTVVNRTCHSIHENYVYSPFNQRYFTNRIIYTNSPYTSKRCIKLEEKLPSPPTGLIQLHEQIKWNLETAYLWNANQTVWEGSAFWHRSRVSNWNSVARNCPPLCEISRNCSWIVRNFAELRGIARNCKEFTGLANARPVNPLALETLHGNTCPRGGAGPR